MGPAGCSWAIAKDTTLSFNLPLWRRPFPLWSGLGLAGRLAQPATKGAGRVFLGDLGGCRGDPWLSGHFLVLVGALARGGNLGGHLS